MAVKPTKANGIFGILIEFWVIECIFRFLYALWKVYALSESDEKVQILELININFWAKICNIAVKPTQANGIFGILVQF
jgi:hypothetical protein